MSKSCWMNKIIYSSKIVLLKSKIPENTIGSPEQLEKIQRFLNFCVVVHIPWWLTIGVVADAPINNFLLIKSIIKYAEVADFCSQSVLKSFSNHLWYVCEETVALSMFSSKLSNQVKEKMVEKLLQCEKNVSTYLLS